MTTAREYARSSKGKGNRSRSTEDQHTDNVRAEAEFGPWTWGAPYADTGSASIFATKARGDFDKLMADLTDGTFGEPGDVLVLWEISRLARETLQGTQIIKLCEAGGYRIHVTSEERTFDPRRYNDWYALVVGVADAERESRRLSARTLRGVNSNVDHRNDDGDPAARPHGVIPYGFQREYGLVDGRSKPVRQFEHPEEAKIVRELFRRVLAGESIMSVSRDFTQRGLTGRRGKPFSAATLRVTLTTDAYRGYRVHKDRTVKASWDPIVDDETWRGVQALLADPSRRSHTGSGVKHVLSMILRCDVCEGPMTVTYRRAVKSPLPPAYQCRDGACVRINKDPVDAYLIGTAASPGTLLAYLSRPDVASQLAPDSSDTELTSVRADLSAVRVSLREFEEAPPARTLAESTQRARSVEALEADITALETKEASLTRPDPLSRLIETGPGAASRWEATPLSAKRTIASVLLSENGPIGQCRVRRVADSPSDSAQDRLVFVRA